MPEFRFKALLAKWFLVAAVLLFASSPARAAGDAGKAQGPPKVPVRVAAVTEKMVSGQISLVGTTEAIATSIVAAEVSGVVENFPVQEGDFVKKGELLVRLRSSELKIRLKGAVAARETVRARLENAEKELNRLVRLKDSDSISARKYEEALYSHQALSQELQRSQADIERLEYEIRQTGVNAPFSGFVAREHTQVGEWVNVGGPVVTLVDLGKIRIAVDVPERYSVMLSRQDEVRVVVRSVSDEPLKGRLHAILPQGDTDSRTFRARLNLANPGFRIKSGMEALVTFLLSDKKQSLLVPKDAVVTAGENRMVYKVVDATAAPVPVEINGYYDGDVAVSGNLKPGDQVVIRGNERLRPGQPVMIQE